MEFIKVSAKTVEDAIIEASIQLETSSDNIEYEVLDAGSTGFLGLIGTKPAVIRARRKKEFDLDTVEEEIKVAVKEVSKEVKPKEKEPRREVRREPKKELKKEPKKENRKEGKKEGKKEPKPTLEKAAAQTALQERPSRRASLSEEEKETAALRARKFLNDMMTAMGMEVEIKAFFDEEDCLNVDLAGADMGILIGKRGQTLDSVQYLTSLVVNKEISGYIRVKVDTENYRIRRKETLENLARNIASKVKRTRKPVFLEPMNPYERRIIHSALQNDPYVSTHSEGEEPYRKVVVTLKK